MQIKQLSDGSWVTSPFYMGFKPVDPCDENEHVWEDVGDKMPAPPGVALPQGANKQVVQRCVKCHYTRNCYTKE